MASAEPVYGGDTAQPAARYAADAGSRTKASTRRRYARAERVIACAAFRRQRRACCAAMLIFFFFMLPLAMPTIRLISR